ncbi:hypothetical protein TNCV_788041 [Trichonephila clavipes]|nr:hypothetical protein TNCV_788041 [Trichonephila clavipes]
MERLRQSCSRSMRVAACELGIPQKTISKILRKQFHYKPDHLQLTQQTTEDNREEFVRHSEQLTEYAKKGMDRTRLRNGSIPLLKLWGPSS